ncbi:PAS domain S-box protein [Imbroritus primus]|uniref:PAS domain S-box protein n=1 Tax=Imbroritus primus TaxID=3058603 RepID=A0ACD3SR66_9BURK|nr:PAS domain S-box protein [Burkholderiaceae bacterium PBA]
MPLFQRLRQRFRSASAPLHPRDPQLPSEKLDAAAAELAGEYAATSTRRPKGLWRLRWWRSWRSGWYILVPVVAMVLFACSMALILWTLHQTEIQQQRDSLYRDAAWAQQKVRLSLLSNQDQLASLARDIAAAQLDQNAYRVTAQEILREHPEIVFINWLDAGRRTRWALPSTSEFASRMRETPDEPVDPDIAVTFETARETQRVVYSRPLLNARGESFMLLLVPIVRDNDFLGTLSAVYSINGILTHLMPAELTERYKFSLIDKNNILRASTSRRPAPNPSLSYEVLLDPPGHSLSLRADAYPPRSNLPNTMMAWLVGGLSCFVLWSLWSVWRHTRQRAEAQRALLEETSFRRAMENSMLIGLRALDLSGRITYVNPAFCRMTGWSEAELVGRSPPFPYWPPNRDAEMQQRIDDTLAGKAPPTGYEMRVMRRNGTSFYARMYVSPLVDGRGVHTGWMSSMTDITEPKRAREELAAAHERFTTVLESLDSAVSVVAPVTGELLFANRYYQQLFGNGAEGHLALEDTDPEQNTGDVTDYVDAFAGLPASELTTFSTDAREVYMPDMQKWFEVRRRYIQWVDGHLAQMQIATDITSRRMAEDMARQHEERLQFTSRLTTMGEMASSLAHELNQPLAAISNYCMGAVARLRSGRSSPEDLIPVLEKTATQAVRAGTIIQRIRGFVKRSQPQRRETILRDIVEDAVGLAEIEASRRKVTLVTRLPAGNTILFVDPVLIEQVLVNLLKNAVEAMGMLQGFRATGVVRLHAQEADSELGRVVMIDVIDQGPGVDEATKERLFEPFFSTKSDGMGMGLNICRSIIESHQGRLWVENNADGVGCTFKIMLPLTPVLHDQ